MSLGNTVTASFAVVVVIVVEVVAGVLAAVACIVVVFAGEILLFLAVVSCTLVEVVVKGVPNPNTVVLLSSEGVLAVNSPVRTAG